MKRLQVHGFGQLTNLRSFCIKTPATTSSLAVAMETQKKKGEQLWVLKKMKAVYVTATLLLSSFWLRAKFITITTWQNVSEICEWKQPSLCSYSSLLVRQERWTDVLLEPMKVIQEKNNSVCEEGGMCCFAVIVFISSIRTRNQENNTSLRCTCKTCTHLTFRLTNYLSFWNFLFTLTVSV